jgi:hypothetical protein
MTSQPARRHSIRAGLPAINPPKLATAFTHFCSPVRNGTSGNTPRSSGPCHTAFDLQSWMIDGGRPCFWLQQGHSFKIRRIWQFVGQWWSRRLDRRRVYDDGRCEGQLTGVENDFFRPFVRRLDPDNRSIETDRLIGKHRWGRWQTRAGDEQQSRKHASDEDKIAGYRHRLSLPKIEQFRFSIKTPEKPNPSLDSHRLARRRCRNDGSWRYFGRERHEAQHPDGECSPTRYAPHIGSSAVAISRRYGVSAADSTSLTRGVAMNLLARRSR